MNDPIFSKSGFPSRPQHRIITASIIVWALLQMSTQRQGRVENEDGLIAQHANAGIDVSQPVPIIDRGIVSLR
jgi:hypothetical protein